MIIDLSLYLKQFSAIALIHFLAVMSPGPDFAVVLKQSFKYGREASFFTSLGISIGIIIHMTYCILGFGYIISTNITLYNILKITGGTYLCFVGIKSIFVKNNLSINFNNYNNLIDNRLLLNKKSFILGFMTNVLNPKATLFFLSLFSILIGETTPLSIQIFYGLWMVAITGIWFCFVSIFFTSNISKIFVSKYTILIDKIMGVVLVYISIKLIFI